MDHPTDALIELADQQGLVGSGARRRERGGEDRLRVIVRRKGHEGRTNGPHRRAVPGLGEPLEDCGRSVLLGHRPRLLELLREGLSSGFVTFGDHPVHLQDLLWDEVGEGAYHTLRAEVEPLPEVVLGPDKNALVTPQYGLGVAGLTP